MVPRARKIWPPTALMTIAAKREKDRNEICPARSEFLLFPYFCFDLAGADFPFSFCSNSWQCSMHECVCAYVLGEWQNKHTFTVNEYTHFSVVETRKNGVMILLKGEREDD